MVRNSFLRSAALAVIAAAGALAVPALAQDSGRDEARAAAREARAQARQERRADAPQRAQAVRGDGWQGRAEARQAQRAVATQQRSAPDAGWRGQRQADGQRFGRGRDNGGGVVAQVPQRSERAVRTWRGGDRAVTRVDQGSRGEAVTVRDGRDGQNWRERTVRDGARYTRDGERSSRDVSRYTRDGYRDGARYNRDSDRSSRYTRDGYRDGGRYDRDGSRYGWNRNEWRRDRRYDWSSYRNNNRQLFSIGRYYSPYRNYSYRRLNIGLFLDSGFYGNRYWVNDPWQYRLPEVYGPYRWVRYYDDVLLVDIYTGEVVDVINDFFW